MAVDHDRIIGFAAAPDDDDRQGHVPEDVSGHLSSHRTLSTILDEWRAAERARDATEPGSDAWRAADERIQELRTEYREAFPAGPG